MPTWLNLVSLVLKLLLLSSTWELLLVFKARKLVSAAGLAQYLLITNIDFTSARSFKRKLDGAITSPESLGLRRRVQSILLLID